MALKEINPFIVTAKFIDELKSRVLSGGKISFDEAMALVRIDDEMLFDALISAAHEITLHFHSKKAHICSLINAKSYLCGEDCKFCAQSVRYATGVARYQLLTADEVLQAAKQVEAQGIQNFCIVTSGNELSDLEFSRVIEIIARLKAETKLGIDGCLGFLARERVHRLKEAGMRRVNSNLQTSREFFPEIVSTHTYEERLESLDCLREEGMEICSGGIFGMGEVPEDRIKMAFELEKYQPSCVPVNVLIPRPGTPLAGMPKMEADEVIKTIAIYRFIFPHATIKLAGGRELNLGAKQSLAMKAGANGVVSGGYLTTGGNSFEADKMILENAGYEP